MEVVKRCCFKITGIVQGVGFRPFIYNLAKSLSLTGWVNNSSEGVFIDVEGVTGNLELFLKRLKNEAPVLSNIKSIHIEEKRLLGYTDFKINDSVVSKEKNVYISADISTCKDCEKEFNDLKDRRHLYPFINCTNCGPRLTIIQDIPYDRENTTMKKFVMCEKCFSEYTSPEDRRYHAQPVSCHNCGPVLELRPSPFKSDDISDTGINAVKRTQELISQGFIIAVKGLGGYHLVCDALNEDAVKRLRKRKIRDDKPFAVMVKDLDTALKYCNLNDDEQKLLESEKKPIVLLKKHEGSFLPDDIAPGNPSLGLMLPYTPIHLLLFHEFSTLNPQPSALVMTSANRSSEPIYYKDNEAYEYLKDIADYFLSHDRDIYLRTDDSVTRIFRNREYILRRARGYVPKSIAFDYVNKMQSENGIFPFILACGGELKSTFCLNKGNEFILSHHIGDLENLETLNSFEEGIEHFKRIFSIQVDTIAYDLHPEYLSTKYALSQDVKNKIAIQHHHAHIASCMGENGLNEDIIGVAFDGTGYGEDGNIWGGEFFCGSYNEFIRLGHFDYVKMPGGEMAIKEPWRMAVSYLHQAYGGLLNESIRIGDGSFDYKGEDNRILKDIETGKINSMINIIERNINCPLTSSAGRLFDAVSALIGVRSSIWYEGQAAIELEYISDKNYYGEYSFKIHTENGVFKVDVREMIKGIVEDIKNGAAKGVIASKFHETVANITLAACIGIRDSKCLNKVVLSGGVFQNMTLLEKCVCKLECSGFEVYTHSNVPTNDGGLSFGQAVIAAVRIPLIDNQVKT